MQPSLVDSAASGGCKMSLDEHMIFPEVSTEDEKTFTPKGQQDGQI